MTTSAAPSPLSASTVRTAVEQYGDTRPAHPPFWDLGGWARRPSEFMRRRLSAAIAEVQDRLDGGMGLVPDPDTTGIDLMLYRARRYLATEKVLEGWQQVYDARLALVDLYTPETLEMYRLSIREEARDLLHDGRLRSIESLLGHRERDRSSPLAPPSAEAARRSRAEVRHARSILDSFHQGLYMRATHARTQLFFLPIVLGLILSGLLLASFTLGSPYSGSFEGSLIDDPGFLLWIYGLGALGALLSVTLGAIRGLTKHNYLLLTEFRLNVTRSLLGAASAAAVVAILETDLLNMGTEFSDRTLVLAVAIAAGFSERLLTNAISAVVQANGPK